MKEIAPRIIIDPEIQGGKPVIKGTRIPVDLVLGKIAGGVTIEELIREYGLKREDIFAALKYAAQVIKEETLIYT
ncbi:MAG: hypothetical protein AUK06_02700 [Parcubacteria group bacterium CG2_30_36_18]|uniref:Antitoxin n=2 Tax=Candidatus Nealsoniibacteriota TaxID=1817911 RepID=A0A2M8DLY1_9BACT|nr:MAG: hypothetical protein AUK06_02700 [Parcubacteria group bacterium CG2_30_36_18]PIP24705.1 MAG: hypothetical protein COX33_00460 [Candidatus Nealsonbacteria bacterium CG23_combo_of_CG06-09_8_20_14_all_36_125]PJB98901.1 MAG: hypothetical protein CO078_00515 [Candidatus Nealsonbacteria bacterium CG_4_9_14_0_8_um_filter_36_17]